MTPKETIRDITESLMRDCRVPADRQRRIHERIARAVWRDRVEVMDLVEAPGDGRVARFVRSQKSGKTVAL